MLSLKPRLNLAGKILLVLSVPLLFQIALFSRLVALQISAEGQLTRLQRPLKAMSEMAALLYNFLSVGAVSGNQQMMMFLMEGFDRLKDEVNGRLNRLQELETTEPANELSIAKMKAFAQEMTKTVSKIIDEISPASLNDQESKQLIREAVAKFRTIDDEIPGLLAMLEREREHARDDSGSLDRTNDAYTMTLLFGAGAELVLVLVSLLWFGSNIAGRFDRVIDNAYKLASRRELNPPVSGHDEIASIDSAFHSMAGRLASAKRVEKLIADNTGTLFCALSERLSIVDASSASWVLLGYEPEEMLQMKVANLLIADDGTEPAALFESLKSESKSTFEGRCLRKDGIWIDTQWSVNWSTDKETYFCVVHDNSEQKNAERIRSDVLRLLTADMQRPLSVVSRVLKQLEQENLAEKELALLPSSVYATTQMQMLVRDLLDLENIEAGTLAINITTQPCAEILKEAAAICKGVAQKFDVTVNTNEPQVVIAADGHRVVQILVNLICNAIKFSDPGSRVEVEATPKGGAIEFSVTDYGRGIPEDLLESIFDRFKQVESSDARKKGGTGLGLAICKALTELHQGQIAVTSNEETGTRFVVSIPQALKELQ